MLKPSESGEQITFARTADQFESDEAGVQGYICENCGAELMTEDTTTATECPYCGSPTILPDRIDGGEKPEKAIPFTVSKEQAQKQFENYFKGKKLLPNVFLSDRNRISEMRRLFVPYRKKRFVLQKLQKFAIIQTYISISCRKEGVIYAFNQNDRIRGRAVPQRGGDSRGDTAR